MALKKLLKDERPIGKHSPTLSEFKIKETSGNIEAEKAKWISYIQKYENYSNPDFIHAFFGKMDKEQICQLSYKHTDHHLRQFDA